MIFKKHLIIYTNNINFQPLIHLSFPHIKVFLEIELRVTRTKLLLLFFKFYIDYYWNNDILDILSQIIHFSVVFYILMLLPENWKLHKCLTLYFYCTALKDICLHGPPSTSKGQVFNSSSNSSCYTIVMSSTPLPYIPFSCWLDYFTDLNLLLSFKALLMESKLYFML